MSRTIRKVIWIVAFALSAYLALLVILWTQQVRLIYPVPKSIGPTTGGFEQIAYRTDDGLDLSAGYRRASPGKPTILYFHGNGADWVSSVVATDRLVPEGYGVLAAEYRGYRGNPGRPNELGLYDDGRAAVRWLGEQGINPDQIVIIGNSIGSGVATQMAIEYPSRALVLISPFSSLPKVVGQKVWFAPTSFLVRDQFNNLSKFPVLDIPILLLHGDADTLIPDSHSRDLAKANQSSNLTIFSGIGHDLAWQDEAEMAVLAFLEGIDAQD